MATLTALLLAAAASLFEPVPSPALSFAIDADGRAWILAEGRVTVSADPAVFSWPLTEPYIDRGSAQVLSIDPGEGAMVLDRRESGQGVEWRLVSVAGQTREVTVRVGALVPDLRVDWQQLVLCGPKHLEWALMAKVNGWKGSPLDNSSIATPFGDINGLDLRADLAPSLLVSSEGGVPWRQEVRWDSADNRDTPARLVCLDRDLKSPFGRRRLPAGRLTVRLNDADFAQDFKGSAPGQLIELRAGDATGVLVKRTKAATTQVNTRSDAHRRLALFDEKIEYEYALTNATDAAVTLEVYEHPARGWRVDKASVPWKKLDAGTLILTVKLGARSEAKVTAVLFRKNLTPA
jgi:hypothetical protein